MVNSWNKMCSICLFKLLHGSLCTRLYSKYFKNTSSWNSQDSCVRCCYWLATYLQIPFTHLIQSLIFSLSTLKWFSNNSLCTKIQTFPFWHSRKTFLPSTHQAWEILCHKQNPLIHICLHTCSSVCLSSFKVSFFKSYFDGYLALESFPGFPKRNHLVLFSPCLQHMQCSSIIA